MQTEVALEIRNSEYTFTIEECALPVILAARAIGCTTGEHLAEFLNAVGVGAPNGGVSAKVSSGKWTKNSANRAVRALVKRGLLKWHRHRGKRNPNLEAKRIAGFTEAVKKMPRRGRLRRNLRIRHIASDSRSPRDP